VLPAARALRARPAVLALVAVAVCLAAAAVPVRPFRATRLPLLTSAVAVGADGRLVPLSPAAAGALAPGTRVLAIAGADRASAQRDWLAAGSVPGADGPYGNLVTDALLDLDTLTLADGAALAGWPEPWRYVWPRDASFAAAAFAATGHGDDALRVLEYLQALQPAAGIFQARYRSDGTGPPDARGQQSDGSGLVLWAAARLVARTPDAAGRAAVLERLRPLVDRSTAALLRLTAGRKVLPPPSGDYWEVHDDRLSLGTAAPIAAGLAAAADLYAAAGEPGPARTAAARATALYAAIDHSFGRTGYPRYLGDTQPDASIAFLLPPFRREVRPAVLAAWRFAALGMARTAGGLAPGAGWRDDGVSWTPETALFALAAAASGQQGPAEHWLAWLRDHRTTFGALPEKVLADGSPAGPAPLTFTAAVVVLAAAELTPPPPASP
jgi:glucoamylase